MAQLIVASALAEDQLALVASAFRRKIGCDERCVRGRRAPAAPLDADAAALDEGGGKNRDGEQDRDERFGVTGKIKVPHGVRPFNIVRRKPRAEVYLVTFLSKLRRWPRNSYALGRASRVFSPGPRVCGSCRRVPAG